MSSSRMTQRIPIRVTSTTADRTTKNRSTLNIFGERMVMNAIQTERKKRCYGFLGNRRRDCGQGR